MKERWKPIPSLPGYEASDQGRVRSWRACGRKVRRETPRLRKPVPAGPEGRHTMVFCIDRVWSCRWVHHLVLEAFVCRKPVGKEARHKNGDAFDNRLSNLVWGTHLENEKDKVLHGTTQHGERNHQCKVSRRHVAAIRRSRELGRVLAERYGVRESTISRIRKGRRRAQG